MSDDHRQPPAVRVIALPTGQLFAVAWAAAALVGIGWAAVCLVRGSVPAAITGLLGASAVAVAASIAMLALQPWRPKSLLKWPSLWMAASFLRLFLTLAGTFLLYSATPYHSRSLWFAAAVAYVAVLVGETRVYASSMRRLAPGAGSSGTMSGAPISDSVSE